MKRKISRYITSLLTVSLIMTGSSVPVYALEEESGQIGAVSYINTDEQQGIVEDADTYEDSDNTEISDAPLNAVIQETDDEEAPDMAESAEPWDGYIPEEYLTNMDVDIEVEESQVESGSRRRAALPVSYRTDAADLPPIKNQTPFGTCWSFSTLASCEGSLIKQGYADASEIDLAERALCYFFYDLKGIDDPLGNTKDDYNEPVCSALGKHDIYQLGGNAKLAMFTLANWAAGVNESRAPYERLVEIGTAGDLTINNENRGEDALPDPLCYQSDFHLQQARLISKTQSEGIKRAVMDNGIVSVSYYHVNGSTYYNSETAAYNSGSVYADSTNHAVCIVGWDDEFPVESFNASRRPSDPGAWLIRNSWGSSQFDGGYMWISYEDKSLSDVTVFTCDPGYNYDNNYFYTGAAGISYFGNEETWHASNIYTVSGDEILKAVSFFPQSPDIEYSLQIYAGLTDPKNPMSGTPMLSDPIRGKTGYAGFYTIPLDKGISLYEGEKFSVVFTIEGSKNLYTEKTGQSTARPSGEAWVKYIADIDEGQSYVCVSGNEADGWFDLAGRSVCLRINAYTDNGAEIPPSYDTMDHIHMITNRSGRVGDYSQDLYDVLEKKRRGMGRRWEFEAPDTVLSANNLNPTVSLNLISQKYGAQMSGSIAVDVTSIGFEALEDISERTYINAESREISGNVIYTGADPVTPFEIEFSSSDENVLRIDRSGGKTYLTPTGLGTAVISANLICGGEKVDYIEPISKSISVLESTISFNKLTLDFNTAMEKPYDRVEVINGYLSGIEEVSLEDAPEYSPEYSQNPDGSTGYLTVRYNGNKANKAMETRLVIKLKDYGITVYQNIKLVVRNKQPGISIKTVDKVDHLYTGHMGEGRLTVTTNEGSISDIELVDADRNGKTGNTPNPLAYEMASKSLDGSSADVWIKGNGKDAKWNKGRLRIWLEGSDTPLTKDISIGYMTSTLKADKSKSVVLVSPQGVAWSGNAIKVNINNSTRKIVEPFDEPVVTITDTAGKSLGERYHAVYDGSGFVIRPGKITVDAKGEELNISISDKLHATEFKLSRFKVTKQEIARSSLALEKSTVTTYFYEDDPENKINNGLTVSTTLMVRNCDGAMEDILNVVAGPVGADSNSRAVIDGDFRKLKVELDRRSGEIKVSYPQNEHPAAGTYKFNFVIPRGTFEGLKNDIKTTLTVRVKKLDAVKAATGKATLKGKINVLYRNGSFLEVKPSFSNVPDNYTITGITLTGSDKDKFDTVTLNGDDQKYYIRLKDSIKVSTKEKYTINIIYTLSVGGGTLTVSIPNVKLSVSQTNPKVTTFDNVYFDAEKGGEKEPLRINANLSTGESVLIDRIELSNPDKGFSVTDAGNGLCYVNYQPSGKLKPGNSYTLKLKVYLKEGATDKAPINLNCKVNTFK